MRIKRKTKGDMYPMALCELLDAAVPESVKCSNTFFPKAILSWAFVPYSEKTLKANPSCKMSAPAA